MRNYVVKSGVRGMFSVDIEKEEFNVVDPIRSHIDWIYSIPEDGVLNLPGGDKKDVKKGDFAIVFYNSPYTKHQVVVIDSSEWRENTGLEKEYEALQENSNECASSN